MIKKIIEELLNKVSKVIKSKKMINRNKFNKIVKIQYKIKHKIKYKLVIKIKFKHLREIINLRV